nr:twin-arginine translocase TatA/TatE family subunit [Anaeromyxobacter sp. SG22]
MGELLVVLFIVLLFFGASRLPALGEGLGKALRSLKGAVTGDGVAAGGEKAGKAPPRELGPGGGDGRDER